VIAVAIKFEGLKRILAENDIRIKKVRELNIMSLASYEKIRKGIGGIDTRTINRVCKYFNVQPGDIMEYVPDEEENKKD
jgi:putative transcriptional regulator